MKFPHILQTSIITIVFQGKSKNTPQLKTSILCVIVQIETRLCIYVHEHTCTHTHKHAFAHTHICTQPHHPTHTYTFTWAWQRDKSSLTGCTGLPVLTTLSTSLAHTGAGIPTLVSMVTCFATCRQHTQRNPSVNRQCCVFSRNRYTKRLSRKKYSDGMNTTGIKVKILK